MFTAWEYIQAILHLEHRFSSSFIAKHMSVSHDTISDYLNSADSRPAGLWKRTQGLIQDSPQSYLLIDDSVISKPYGPHIELSKNQYSGATHSLVNGINTVNLVHVNRDGDTAFPIDFAIYCPDVDGKTKNDIFRELIARSKDRGIQAKTVLFDSWYASVENLKFLQNNGYIFYSTMKSNRKISLSPADPYTPLDQYDWGDLDPMGGVLVKLKELPFKLWLFKVVTKKGDIDWIITNDPDHNHDNRLVAEKNKVRWKIEELHRELKQNALSDRCQARTAKAQRNHILCAFKAVVNLRYWAKISGLNPYEVKTKLREGAMTALFQRGSWRPIIT